MFKRSMWFIACLLLALAIGVSTGLAASDVFFQATNTTYQNGSQNFAEFSKSGLFFTGMDNHIRTYGGIDRLNFGDDEDWIQMSNGVDVIAFGGIDDTTGLVTFDLAGTAPGSPLNSEVYLRVDTPDTDPFMELRANDVMITADSGDVIIQLGS